jgi:glycosyltransferase involved in cell wall biosynthesis
MSSGKILLVSHNFPPTAGPESHLVRMNAASILRGGWDLRVLTTTALHLFQPLDATLLDRVPPGLEVERVASPEAVFAARFPKNGRRLALWTGRNLLPEEFFPWAFPATRRGRSIIASWQPHVIYSRATKHVSNVVGWRLKRATGLPWVAHFSDPWISSRMPPIPKLLGSVWARRILRDADALVFVTRQAAEHVLAGFPTHYRKRVHIIPHGFEDPSPDLARTLEAARDEAAAVPRRLRLIHAGAFYPTMRGPETLIEALRRLSLRHPSAELPEIECVGADTEGFQPLVDAAGLGEVLRLEPAVPFGECQRRIARSDAILALDAPGSGGIFLPTKLIEAFAFGKPVLGICDADSAMASILGEAGQGWADSRDPGAIVAELEKLMDWWISGDRTLPPAAIAKMRGYQIDRINEPLLELFGRLASGR